MLIKPGVVMERLGITRYKMVSLVEMGVLQMVHFRDRRGRRKGYGYFEAEQVERVRMELAGGGDEGEGAVEIEL